MSRSFRNNTACVVRALAKADLKRHRMKTALAGAIVTLATCLLAVVFLVSVNSTLNNVNAAPYHAAFRSVTEETAAALEADPNFDVVGRYQAFGSLWDQGRQTSLLYLEETLLDLLGYQVVAGTLPAGVGEVLVSQDYLEGHGLSLGDTFSFSYTDAFSKKPQTQTFTVCGVAHKDKTYGYLLTSDAFRQAMAARTEGTPEAQYTDESPSSFDLIVTLSPEKASLSPQEIEDLIQTTADDLNIPSYNAVVNSSYVRGFWLDSGVVLGLACFAVFLAFACGFAIYSIFYISVVDAMPMYAQLRSLGTTPRQLRRFLEIQGDLLALCFIPLGLLLSLAAALLTGGSRWLAYDLPILAGSGLVVYWAVKAALGKPSKVLARLSLVEAMGEPGGSQRKDRKPLSRLTPGALAKNNLAAGRRKNRMAVLSLSVSGTLMVAFILLLGSLDLTGMLRQSFPLDEAFQVGIEMDNYHARFPQVVQNNPLSQDLQEEIAALPGVEAVVPHSVVLSKVATPSLPYPEDDDRIEALTALTPEYLAAAVTLVEGDLSPLGPNEILLNQNRIDSSDGLYDSLRVGETITFTTEGITPAVSRTFTIKGIVFAPTGDLFLISPEAVAALSPYNNTSHLSILCSPEAASAIQPKLEAMLSQNPDLTVSIYQQEYQMADFFIKASMGSLYGISAFVIFFGILNMVNLLVSSALLRKREFALLQAVGMTRRQLRTMLRREGLSISGRASLLSALLGMGGGWLLCRLAREVLSLEFFHFQFRLLPILLFALSLLLVQLLVSQAICKTLEKHTLTQRLRMI